MFGINFALDLHSGDRQNMESTVKLWVFFLLFLPSPSLTRFQRAMGGVPAWADLENTKKSKRTASDGK